MPVDPFVGEIMLVPYNFAPSGWAFCQGQLLPVSQNTVLFSLLGVTYGGDGRATFGLPDLRGRAPLSSGQGPGLQNYVLGQAGGQETVTLLASEMPAHTHAVQASNGPANQQSPAGGVLATEPTGQTAMYSNTAPNTTLSAAALASAGGGQPHENRAPFLTLNFCIALQGTIPTRP